MSKDFRLNRYFFSYIIKRIIEYPLRFFVDIFDASSIDTKIGVDTIPDGYHLSIYNLS